MAWCPEDGKIIVLQTGIIAQWFRMQFRRAQSISNTEAPLYQGRKERIKQSRVKSDIIETFMRGNEKQHERGREMYHPSFK